MDSDDSRMSIEHSVANNEGDQMTAGTSMNDNVSRFVVYSSADNEDNRIDTEDYPMEDVHSMDIDDEM